MYITALFVKEGKASMWPKRKKGKARATKVKLKALQPTDDSLDDSGSQEVAAPPPAAEPVNPRSKEEELISGVWKSKVLNNYKQNPKDSHNLLARIPTGKAAFEAGERQKNEAIKDAMIRIVDRMFDNFQNTAYEFNRVTAGSDLELAWIRPSLIVEDLGSWHESAKGTLEVFAGRISTRYWTLAVRGTVASIDTFILPSDKLLGFSTSPTSFPSYLTITPESDGMTVGWTIANQSIDLDLFPSVYRALLDGLIRFASDEAQPGEAFRLEDIGIVPEAPAAPGAFGYQEKDYSERPELLGQRNGRASLDVGVSDPRISEARSPRADRFIDDISNQVAQAAQSETDRFRQSMHAPPFGTTQGGPRSDGSSSESGVYRASESASGVYRANQQSQDSGAYRGDSNPFKPVDQSGVLSAQGAGLQGEGEWKTVSAPRAGATDWQKFMQNTRDSIQQNQPARDDDKWNTVPGTQQLARPDVPRASIDNMMAPAPPQNYPSYGNASDPPELLKPDDINIPPSQISQSGIYGVQQHSHQSGAYSGPQPLPALQPPAAPSINQSGAPTPQSSPPSINQSGAFSTQMSPPPPPPPSINQSGGFSTQVGQSGVFAAPSQKMPPNMMAPGYAVQPPAPPQAPPPQAQMMPPPPPSMMTPPGMPSFPGMIQPGITQSGAHPQPMMPPPAPPMYPPGMQAPMMPPGMAPPSMPPQGMAPGMPPNMVPPHMVPSPPTSALNQPGAAGHPQLPPQQQPQFNTGGHLAPPVPPPQFSAVPQGFNSGPFGGAAPQEPRALQAPEPPPAAFQIPASDEESEENSDEDSQDELSHLDEAETEDSDDQHVPEDESAQVQEAEEDEVVEEEAQNFEALDDEAGFEQNTEEIDLQEVEVEVALANEAELEETHYDTGDESTELLESDDVEAEAETQSELDAEVKADIDSNVDVDVESQVELEVGDADSVSESGDWNTVETTTAKTPEPEEIPESSWQQPTVVTQFSMVTSREEMIDPPMADLPSFPQESFTELPVISKETVQRFEQASKAGFVFSSEDDFVDAISVVLSTIDSQIELLAQQGTQAFSAKDFRRAEAIIKLSERLTSFKTEAQEIMQVLSSDDK